MHSPATSSAGSWPIGGPRTQKKAGQPREPEHVGSHIQRRRTHPGHVSQGMDLRVGRRVRHDAPEDPASAPARLEFHARADGRTLATSDVRLIDERDQNPTKDITEDTIRLYDIETGEQILTLEPGHYRAGAMVFSPDGERLFTGFDEGPGIVWDVRPRQGTPN